MSKLGKSAISDRRKQPPSVERLLQSYQEIPNQKLVAQKLGITITLFRATLKDHPEYQVLKRRAYSIAHTKSTTGLTAQAVYQCRKEGQSLAAMASRFGVTKQRISQILKPYRAEFRILPVSLDRAWELYLEGVSLREVAKQTRRQKRELLRDFQKRSGFVIIELLRRKAKREEGHLYAKVVVGLMDLRIDQIEIANRCACSQSYVSKVYREQIQGQEWEANYKRTRGRRFRIQELAENEHDPGLGRSDDTSATCSNNLL